MMMLMRRGGKEGKCRLKLCLLFTGDDEEEEEEEEVGTAACN